jgi:biotin carboxylase
MPGNLASASEERSSRQLENARPPRVLHLGWKPNVEPRILRDLGAEVTCIVSPSDERAALDSRVINRVISVPDPASVNDVLGGLARMQLSLNSFDYISPANEMELLAASVLRHLARLPGMPLSTAVALRDKDVQKRQIRLAGVPVTTCFTTTSLDAIVIGPDDRFVVKPVAGLAAVDTFVIDEADGLNRLRVQFPEPRLWLVERFIEGNEVSLDGVVRGGEVKAFTVSKYLENMINIRSGGEVGSITFNRVAEPALYDNAAVYLSRCLDAIGLTDGAFHLESFLNARGHFVFSELGGRVGGGAIPATFQSVTGIDMHSEWARATLEMTFGESNPARVGDEETAGWVQLNSRAGTIRSLPTEHEMLSWEGVIFAELKVATGQHTRDRFASTSNCAARVVIAGKDEVQIRGRMSDALQRFDQAVSVDDTASEDIGLAVEMMGRRL